MDIHLSTQLAPFSRDIPTVPKNIPKIIPRLARTLNCAQRKQKLCGPHLNTVQSYFPRMKPILQL